jgi:hypothetical protein
MRRASSLRIALVGGPMYDPLYDEIAAFRRDASLDVEIVARLPHPELNAFIKRSFESGDALDLISTHTKYAPSQARWLMPLDDLIASSLAQQAELLLLDEPTASLDPGYQLEIAELLRALHTTRGVGIVVSTHDLNLAAAVCDTLVLLREGQVVASGPTDQVLTRERISMLYGIEADVQFHDRAGHTIVVPVRRGRG